MIIVSRYGHCIPMDCLKVGMISESRPLGVGEIARATHSVKRDEGERWERGNKLLRLRLLCLTGHILPRAQHAYILISTISPSDAHSQSSVFDNQVGISSLKPLLHESRHPRRSIELIIASEHI